MENLEKIARHFLGDVPLDEDNLAQIAAKCTTKSAADGLWNVNESFDVQFVSRNVACEDGIFYIINCLHTDFLFSLFRRILALELFRKIATFDERST